MSDLTTLYPRRVGFRGIHGLDLMPGPHCVVVGCTVVIGHIVGNEVYVAAVLGTQRAALGFVEGDRLKDQIAVRDPAARGDLFFAPAIEQVTSPRCALETRSEFRSLPLEE